MSNLEQKAEEIAKQLCSDSFSSKEEIVEKAVILGYMLCKKEYEEKLRWIPVEEKLPPENRTVLVKIKNEFCIALFRKGKFNQDVEFSDNDVVIHWRFL